MSFSSLIAAIDSICQSAFGEISVTVTPSAGGGFTPLVIPNAISKDPTLEDDYIPGSAVGTTNLILFFNPAALPVPLTSTQLLPAHGDKADVNGIQYTISRIKPDNEGAYSLYLRRISVGA
jgi:hypothetical protein